MGEHRRPRLRVADAAHRIPQGPDRARGHGRRRRPGAQGVPAPRHRRRPSPGRRGHGGHVQRLRLRRQDLRPGAAHGDRHRAARGRDVAAAVHARGDLPGTDVDRRGVDQGRQPGRGCAEGRRRGLAGVVHRQHRPLRRRSARAVRAHDRDERQRGAIRRARPDRRAQPPAGGGRGRLRPHPARAGPRREAGVPLPLDPDFYAGRIQASTLVAMGYRDARRYLASMSRRASPSTVGPRR